MDAYRSFDFVEFPPESPPREQLIGHNCLEADRYHGSLSLKITALTPVSIAAGITALGQDVGETVPLIRVMGQDQNGYPVLQGTSLKGCIRAVYETITNSRLGVKGTNAPSNREPQSAKRGFSLSPAELVFGAMGFQGLISIADAVGDRPLEIGYLPPMFQPRYGKGRKFYRHRNQSAAAGTQPDSQPPEPDKPPSPIQQAPTGTVFTTHIRVSNLTLAQLGALLIALGQDADHRFALKLGAGKGKGLGSVSVQLVDYAIAKGEALAQSRYLDYFAAAELPSDRLLISKAIEAAHESCLIHREQLEKLQSILQWQEAGHD